MAVIISNGNVNLSTLNGFYKCTSYNLGMYGGSNLLTSTKYINVTFSDAGNCQGILLAIGNDAPANTGNRAVVVKLQEYSGGSWVTRATKSLTRNQICDNATIMMGCFITPFLFDTPYAVTTASSTWRFEVTQDATSGANMGLFSSDGTNPFYVTWCDVAVSFTSGSDAVICKDKVTINQTATFKAYAVTGVTTHGICGLVTKSSDPSAANVANLVWENPPSSSYTLTLDGRFAMSAHGGVRIGSSTNRIPIAQKAIIIKNRAPSVGDTGSGGFWGIHTSNTNYPDRCSFFAYGEIPTYQKTTLASDANSGQANLVTSDVTGWAPGDQIFIGKQYTKSNGDNNFYTIQSINGVNITLTGNINSNIRKAGGTVYRLGNCGIEMKSDSTTSCYLTVYSCSFLEISGVYFYRIIISAGLTSYAATNADDDAYCSTQKINNVVANTTGNLCSSITPGVKGFEIDSVYVNGLVTGAHYPAIASTVGGSLAVSGTLTIKNSSMCSISNATLVFGTTKVILQNCSIENSNYPTFQVQNYGHEIKNNKFWGAGHTSYGHINIYYALNCIFQGNTYDYCTFGVTFWNAASMGNQFISESFGQSFANTADMNLMGPGVFTQATFQNCLSSYLMTSQANLLLAIDGTFFKFMNFNNTTNDDRVFLPAGVIQRVGDGLTDTTVRTAGSGKFAMRLQPTSGTNLLKWLQTIPTGNIQNKTMSIIYWVKINNSAFYAGVHTKPTLRVNYDNGTEVTAVGVASTDWQPLMVVFSPTTTFGAITAQLELASDAGGSNAYVYLDDIAVNFPPGVVIDNSGLDYWSGALPVTPTIANISLPSPWDDVVNNHKSSGTFGDKLRRLRNPM